MLNELRNKATREQINIKNFYYAYCEKNPNKFHFSSITNWTNLDKNLRKIMRAQLNILIRTRLNKQNHKAKHDAQSIILDPKIKLPKNYQVPNNKSVIDILSTLTDENLTNDKFLEQSDLLVLKYLTAIRSQTSVYAILTFEVDLDNSKYSFVFITLCDLDKEHEELRVDEVTQELVVEIIKNRFKEKSLKKGLLFPYIEENMIDNTSSILYDSESTFYWASAFECLNKFKPSDEQKKFSELLNIHARDIDILPQQVWGEFEEEFRKASINSENDINKKTIKKILAKCNNSFNDTRFDEDWIDHFKDENYTIYLKNIYSPEIKFPVRMNGIRLEVPFTDLKKLKQLKVGDQTYLVISGDEDAVIEKINSKVQTVSWEDFKKEVEG